jgi:alcohol dehydrogenase class IV
MQEEYIGEGSLKNLKKVIKKINAKNILLLTGKKSYSISGAKSKITPFLKGLEVIIFNDFEVNPKIENVHSGINLVINESPDLIIAVGGGTVIDMGKLINILSAQKEHASINIINDSSLINNKGLAPLIAIPTTLGTGSEATHFAVVYVDKKKYSLAHEFMLPDYVIVDPSLSYNLPKNIAASSAIDALSQAVESYWAVGSTIESQRYAKQSIEIILDSIEGAVIDMDTSARNAMALAANLSGKAINISKTTAPHAISYPISTYFNVPHGHAVGLLLGSFFVINSDLECYGINDPRGTSYLTKTINQLFNFFGTDNPLDCKLAWYKLMSDIGLQTNISKLGVNTTNDIDLICDNVNLERLNNNPVIVNDETLKDILKSLF